MVFPNAIATLPRLGGMRSLILLPSLLIESILLHFAVPLYGLDMSPLSPCQIQSQSTREPTISSRVGDRIGTYRTTATSAIKI
jgi:hypothetical protein